MINDLILPFISEHANLGNAGGKGANLARLVRAGFNVPPGFILTTHAYQTFVAANHLEPTIQAALSSLHDPQNLPTETPPLSPVSRPPSSTLQSASDAIRQSFSAGQMPPEIGAALRQAYADLGSPPVAVRSSATAEDLPGLSFAGQQDTFLNVIGSQAVLEAVVVCWSSLWTARAIGYRTHNAMSHTGLSLAVVVQRMLPAEVSGVLFTANPLTGARYETVIDAAFGLGEALVSGQVEPDHYVVDTRREEIVSKSLGAKAVLIRSKPGGGVEKVTQEAAQRQALSDDQILALASVGSQVAAEFDFPQDVEWARVDDELYLLQSRPITSLFSLPDEVDPEQLRVLFSFGAVQGILDPMTPLGRDAIRLIFAGGASLLGYRRTHTTQGVIRTAGERLWGDVTPLLRNRLGRRVAFGALDFIEPSVRQALEQIKSDPRLQPQSRGPSLGLLRRLLPLAFTLFTGVLRYWRDPEGQRRRQGERVEGLIQSLQTDLEALQAARAASPDSMSAWTAALPLAAALFRRLYAAFPTVVPTFVPGIAASMSLFTFLSRQASHLPSSHDPRGLPTEGPPTLALQITRGAPHNVTTQMDLRLWETARDIQNHPASLTRFQESTPETLAAQFLRATQPPDPRGMPSSSDPRGLPTEASGPAAPVSPSPGLPLSPSQALPPPAQQALAVFLDRYGVRGVGEIDIGRPRWREDPIPVMRTLKSYLDIADPSQAPDAVFARGAQAAQEAIDELANAARIGSAGRLRARLVRWAASRVRALIGLRESPKFYIIRMLAIARQGLLTAGQDLVAAGHLEQSDDLFYLTLDELDALAANPSPEAFPRLRELIAERHGAYRREKLRRQVPRLLLSDGRAFYEGLLGFARGDEGEEVITGSPVSPGVVEGCVRVVLDPHTTSLVPGEILVCPGTDPAWTPLFLAAAGLIMEVGGMMTHGSVVAREYGLPAVVGVHQATTRLHTGQRIRLDGSVGRITLLDETP